MQIKIIGNIAAVSSETPLIIDAQSALEFAVSILYEHGCRAIMVNKAALAEDFFRLSTGVAGEVAQKLVNYHIRLAIIGDFSGYTSQPLQDYMRECNRGGHLYFVKDEAEALKKLGGRESI